MNMRKVCRATYQARNGPQDKSSTIFPAAGRFCFPSRVGSVILWPMMDTAIPALPDRLRLDRPLVFFDIEATGLNKRTDRIVAIALVRYEPSGTAQKISYLLNPGVPIPEDATAIHGITDADVEGAPTFADMAEILLDHFAGADLAGYNILGYDIQILTEEFARAGHPFPLEGRRILDAQRIFFRNEPRDLAAALRYYCADDHTDSHDALGDVLATIRVLGGQFQKYAELPADLDGLHEYCDPRDPSWVDRTGRLKWSRGEIVFNFGKVQGQPLREVVAKDPNFLTWLLRSDFPEDTKQIVRNAQAGHYPAPPA
ncbi:MAG: 3'-5' exonuclease [Kiritimatiellia bacterium]|nr:3'-5' exonuclease [Kiritimatiellia bacterium]MBP9572595.1 3'-5' exonuclease [Kiritimatiellia bacterium]HOE36238.1 3'-5' exonuclease [Kiritimatiellia bacterium]HOR73675.1 3'-5' exonuclease [Kiritimatiellia bacterium]HPK68543.1 3'-5' exonuclease [Kiritimatiellia bacterium]